jgi:hypothetical protein
MNRAAHEAALARAHRAVVSAKMSADVLGMEGTYLDLQQIEIELVRILEASLKGKGRRPLTTRARELQGASDGAA